MTAQKRVASIAFDSRSRNKAEDQAADEDHQHDLERERANVVLAANL